MDSASQPVSHLTFTTTALLENGTMTAITKLFVVYLKPVTSVRPSSLRLSNESGCLHTDRLQSLRSLLLNGHRVLLGQG